MSSPPRPQRFRDRWEHLSQFTDEYLVVCPKCSRCGRVGSVDPSTTHWSTPRRFTCQHCGASKDQQARENRWGRAEAPHDGYFDLPLWLRAPCCGHVLWAYNARHLQFLEDYVGSVLRERRYDPKHGWCNNTIASRLPRWMQLAGNRGPILKVIRHLQAKLKDAKSP